MTWWQYLLLVNLYLLLFYGFYALLLRKETFFQLNRVYLVTSALLSFFIPMIHSDWVKNLFITQKVEASLAVYNSPIFVYQFKSIEDHHITIGELLVYIYAAGIMMLTVKFIWQLISLKKIISQPDPADAFSFFKNIRLGEKVDNSDVIEAHEQVHAREWHSADVLLIEAITIINWFNPVVYFYRLGIKHIHEFIADRQALKSGTGKAEYALLLLSQTLKTPAHQLVNPFYNHSLLKRRIIMLQKNHSQRTALLKYGLSAPLFILMLILSSATVSKSETVILFNTKAAYVFLTPALINADKSGVIDQLKTKQTWQVKPEKNGGKNIIDIKLLPPPDTTKKDSRVFYAVEKEPEFKEGIDAFYRFLQQNLRYPAEAKKNNIQGKVFVTFVVEKDGALSGITTIRDIGGGAGDEAIRVLKLSPKWEPGIQNGKPVRVQYTMPISFTLEKQDNPKDTTQKSGYIDLKQNKVEYGNGNLIKTPFDTSKTTRILSGINGGTKPLILLDGREVPDVDSINPNSIESIAIIKPKNGDDSMVLLYGAKALNGVVVIKSKKTTH